MTELSFPVATHSGASATSPGSAGYRELRSETTATRWVTPKTLPCGSFAGSEVGVPRGVLELCLSQRDLPRGRAGHGGKRGHGDTGMRLGTPLRVVCGLGHGSAGHRAAEALGDNSVSPQVASPWQAWARGQLGSQAGHSQEPGRRGDSWVPPWPQGRTEAGLLSQQRRATPDLQALLCVSPAVLVALGVGGDRTAPSRARPDPHTHRTASPRPADPREGQGTPSSLPGPGQHGDPHPQAPGAAPPPCNPYTNAGRGGASPSVSCGGRGAGCRIPPAPRHVLPPGGTAQAAGAAGPGAQTQPPGHRGLNE